MSALTNLAAPWRAGLDACAAFARNTGSPQAMYNLGTVHMRARDLAGAEAWFREALARDPDFVEAHQNLATVLESTNRPDEARTHRDRAFRHAPLRIETAASEQLRVLVLSSAGTGNVPIDNLLPRSTVTRLKFFVEYATGADWDALPAHDVIFNAIGDADLLPPGPWRRQLRRSRRVLNPPHLVAKTRRDRLPRTLAGLTDVVVPRVTRHPSPTKLPFPVLVRRFGAHGGQGVTLIDTPAALGPEPGYLTEYHDYRSADGYFRKYRMIFIRGTPYPCHLAISKNWLVHYFSADMQPYAWKRAEEQAFLETPESAIGTHALGAVAAIGRRLGLDYAGIDFAVLPDGQVLVFEANATMVVHLDDDPVLFDYKHRVIATIFTAFAATLQTFSSSPAA